MKSKFQLYEIEKRPELVPETSGIYFFKFVPGVSFKEFLAHEDYAALYPKLVERARGNRLEVAIELPTIFNSGFTSSKSSQISLMKDETFKEMEKIWTNIKEIVPPLYVGKALNLNRRLNQHIGRKTKLLSDLNHLKFRLIDMTVGWIEIENLSEEKSQKENELEIIEYMIQKMTTPILTQRYG